MMKTKKRRRKDELDRPIYVGSIPIEGTNEEQQELIDQVIEQAAIEKLPLLMKRYGIAEDDYFSLALILALKHEPGFKVVSAKLKLKYDNWGPVIRDTKPTKWPPERLLRLLNAVEETKKKHRLSTDREALKIVMRKGEWSRPLDRDEQKWLESLESRLQDAKRIKRGKGPSPRYRGHRGLDGAAELEEAARLAIAAESAAAAYATLPVELRFTALCLPFSIEQNSGI
jgi:hypothetical protein